MSTSSRPRSQAAFHSTASIVQAAANQLKEDKGGSDDRSQYSSKASREYGLEPFLSGEGSYQSEDRSESSVISFNFSQDGSPSGYAASSTSSRRASARRKVKNSEGFWSRSSESSDHVFGATGSGRSKKSPSESDSLYFVSEDSSGTGGASAISITNPPATLSDRSLREINEEVSPWPSGVHDVAASDGKDKPLRPHRQKDKAAVEESIFILSQEGDSASELQGARVKGSPCRPQEAGSIGALGARDPKATAGPRGRGADGFFGASPTAQGSLWSMMFGSCAGQASTSVEEIVTDLSPSKQQSSFWNAKDVEGLAKSPI